MCGILGIIGGPLPIAELVAKSALHLLKHRGPDDHGVWRADNAWLGHRRLSIIDIGPSGHQPMVHNQTGVAVIFNGEIYNYLELRDELVALGHPFQSHSDTEVLLVAYIAWGKECVRRFNGMWSFLIWDPRLGEAFFSRDRFGVKPFYYTLARGRFSVASEPKALIALYPELRKVDESALYRFLAEGMLCDGEHSFYDGIKILEPAHSGVFRPGYSYPVIKRYWDFPTDADQLPDSPGLAQSFQTLFEDSVRLRLRSDVPVGITLSGGLDSTAVLHASVHNLNNFDGELLAFTSVYRAASHGSTFDEIKWAQIALKQYPRVRLLEVDAESDWLPILRRVAWHMDSPTYSPAVFPLWKIMEAARQKKVPVLLEGQGADELLGGYTQYAALAFLNDMRNLFFGTGNVTIAQVLHNLRAYQTKFGTMQFLSWLGRTSVPALNSVNRQFLGALGTLRKDFVRRAKADQDEPAVDQRRSTVDRRLLADFSKHILPGLLHYGDAISMAHSIESRLPFMDYRLVEFGFCLPSSWKVSNGETKRILREYLRTSGQTSIASRKDKIGYATPIDQWLSPNNAAELRKILLNPDSHILQYCDRKKVGRLIDCYTRGFARTSNHVYRLLTAELWLEGCIFPVHVPK